jgi:hypothetical protein
MAKILKFPKRPGKTREWTSYEARHFVRRIREGTWGVVTPFRRPVEQPVLSASDLTEGREELVQRDTQG